VTHGAWLDFDIDDYDVVIKNYDVVIKNIVRDFASMERADPQSYRSRATAKLFSGRYRCNAPLEAPQFNARRDFRAIKPRL
jgi:hypothetical protein